MRIKQIVKSVYNYNNLFFCTECRCKQTYLLFASQSAAKRYKALQSIAKSKAVCVGSYIVQVQLATYIVQSVASYIVMQIGPGCWIGVKSEFRFDSY